MDKGQNRIGLFLPLVECLFYFQRIPEGVIQYRLQFRVRVRSRSIFHPVDGIACFPQVFQEVRQLNCGNFTRALRDAGKFIPSNLPRFTLWKKHGKETLF